MNRSLSSVSFVPPVAPAAPTPSFKLTADELMSVLRAWDSAIGPPTKPGCSAVTNFPQLIAVLHTLHVQFHEALMDFLHNRFTESGERMSLSDVIELLEDSREFHYEYVECHPEMKDDMMDAFIAVGGGSDGQGNVDEQMLRGLVDEFDLHVDVERIMRDLDTDGINGVDFRELCALLEGNDSLEPLSLSVSQRFLDGDDTELSSLRRISTRLGSFAKMGRLAKKRREMYRSRVFTSGVPGVEKAEASAAASSSLSSTSKHAKAWSARPHSASDQSHQQGLHGARGPPLSPFYSALVHTSSHTAVADVFRARMGQWMKSCDRHGVPLRPSRQAAKLLRACHKNVEATCNRLYADAQKNQKSKNHIIVGARGEQSKPRKKETTVGNKNKIQNPSPTKLRENVDAEFGSSRPLRTLSLIRASKISPKIALHDCVEIASEVSTSAPSTPKSGGGGREGPTTTLQRKHQRRGSSITSSHEVPRKADGVSSSVRAPQKPRSPSHGVARGRNVGGSCARPVLASSVTPGLVLLGDNSTVFTPNIVSENDGLRAVATARAAGDPALIIPQSKYNRAHRMARVDKMESCHSDDYGLSRHGFDQGLYECYYGLTHKEDATAAPTTLSTAARRASTQPGDRTPSASMPMPTFGRYDPGLSAEEEAKLMLKIHGISNVELNLIQMMKERNFAVAKRRKRAFKWAPPSPSKTAS